MKGYQGGHNLINFPSLAPTIEAIFMYLLSSFQLALWFMCLDFLFILFEAPKPHYQHVTGAFRICNMAISKKNQLFTQFFYKL